MSDESRVRVCTICEGTCSKKKSVHIWGGRVHRLCLKRYLITQPDSEARETIISALYDHGYTHDRGSTWHTIYVDKTPHFMNIDTLEYGPR